MNKTVSKPINFRILKNKTQEAINTLRLEDMKSVCRKFMIRGVE